MKPLKTIIVDDEPLALKRLKKLLRDDREVELEEACKSGEEAIIAIDKIQPNLVFLDIQMPKINGFEVLEHIEVENIPVIVFVTAYDQYALQAFDVNAIDYLLKPFDQKRFDQALKRAKKYTQQHTQDDLKKPIKRLLEYHRSEEEHISRLMIKNNDKVFFIPVEQIDWIESAGNYVRIHTGKNNYLIRETMVNMERKLNSELFFRIHRSAIVNVNSIKELEKWFHGDYKVQLYTGKELTMSRNYKDLLQSFS